MARQGITTGITPNDGTGDSLLIGAIKVNQNFEEIYSALGDGDNLLTGDPNLSVGFITATGTLDVYGKTFLDEVVISNGLDVTGITTSTSGISTSSSSSPVKLNIVGSNIIIEVEGVGIHTLALT